MGEPTVIDKMFQERARNERARDALRKWLDEMVTGMRLGIGAKGLQQRHVIDGAERIVRAVVEPEAERIAELEGRLTGVMRYFIKCPTDDDMVEEWLFTNGGDWCHGVNNPDALYKAAATLAPPTTEATTERKQT